MNEEKEWRYCNDEELRYFISLCDAKFFLFLVFCLLTYLIHTFLASLLPSALSYQLSSPPSPPLICVVFEEFYHPLFSLTLPFPFTPPRSSSF